MAEQKKDPRPEIAPDRLDRFAWDDSNVDDLEWEDASTDKKTPQKKEK